MTSLQIADQPNTAYQSKALRVLFLLGTLWGENGITSHLKTLSSGLIQQGIEVAIASDLASMSTDAYNQAVKAVEDFTEQGIKHFIVPFSSGLRGTPQIMQTLDAVVQKFQPTIIHLHSLSVLPYIHLLKLRYKIPFVSTCHMEPSPSNKKSQIIQLAHKLKPNLFGDRFIAISSELHEIFEKSLHVPTERIHRIYHGVDAQRFRRPSAEEKIAARRQFGLTSDQHVICLVGRLSPNKGHRLLVEAIGNLKAQNVSLIALFAGKNYLDELEQLQEFVESKGLSDSVRFLGMVNPLPVLWASDVLVLPSKKGTEAFPLVVLEAMLCGLVPIRTPASGALEQIDNGRTGFIIPFDDYEALASSLKRLLTNEAFKQRLSISAFEFAEQQFTTDKMTQLTLKVYRESLV
jgi:glycosyltransferase involved in cell wall biosynthesis